jgi:hypothetical protein
MKVTRRRIEEKAPPEVAGYETDADWCYLAFTFDFGDERYGAREFDSDPETADVLKQTSGPYDEDRLTQIRDYLATRAGVRKILTLDGRTGAFAEWPR